MNADKEAMTFYVQNEDNTAHASWFSFKEI